ncbi:MAG: type II toxin-antitoxin system RelE/ParE family toxin [Paracoccus sp. (in: a-proteobacteria)]
MKIVFLAFAKPDLRWFKRYYMYVFPEGRRNADQHYYALLNLLKSSPTIGGLAEDFPDAREHHIKNTPFTLIYRIQPDRVEILRLLDERNSFSNERKR